MVSLIYEVTQSRHENLHAPAELQTIMLFEFSIARLHHSAKAFFAVLSLFLQQIIYQKELFANIGNAHDNAHGNTHGNALGNAHGKTF